MTDARDHRPLRVLFVCTGNSARSLLGEVLLRAAGGDAFEVHSAGTHPRGVNPLTIRVLGEAGLPTDGLRSKSVDEYLDQDFDYVITVCDDANESCPVFPGASRRLHWSFPDPSRAVGTHEERLAVFRAVRDAMKGRIEEFLMTAGEEDKGKTRPAPGRRRK